MKKLMIFGGLGVIVKTVGSRGVKIWKKSSKVKNALDVEPLRGKLQQFSLLKITCNQFVDQESFIHITEIGRQQVIELLLAISRIKYTPLT
jgi:hypothetical protein